jgi:hypothetical protein
MMRLERIGFEACEEILSFVSIIVIIFQDQCSRPIIKSQLDREPITEGILTIAMDLAQLCHFGE